MKTSLPFSDRYRTPLRAAFLWTAALGIFSALALDMGRMAALWRFSAAVFVAICCLILVQRPKTPTIVDLLVLTWGFPLLYFCTLLVYPWIWH